MASRQDLDEITRKRAMTAGSGGHRVLEEHVDPDTGAGAIVTSRRLGREERIEAHFFMPRAHRRIARSDTLNSAHERLDVPARMRRLVAEKRAAKVAPHDLQVGEILCETWGVTMRSARFYRVTDIPHPRKVTIEQIAQHSASGDWMAGTVVPDDPHRQVGEAQTYMVSMEHGVPLLKMGNDISYCGRWDGNPVHVFSD